MLTSEWKSAVITYATDDDLTAEVDLGDNYEFLTVLIPTINSATVSIHVSDTTGGTFYPVHDWLDNDADNTVLVATTDGTGGISATFRIGGVQYIKVATSAAQSANRTFKVRGFSRNW